MSGSIALASIFHEMALYCLVNNSFFTCHIHALFSCQNFLFCFVYDVNGLSMSF
jgi:hypothetical protein